MAKPGSRKWRLWRPHGRLQWALTVGAVAVLVAATVWWFVARSANAATPQVTSQTLTVSTTTLKETISASGTIQPEQEVDLSFLTSGAVTSVDVAVGDEVTAGQSLATIDSSAASIARQAAAADLEAAESTLSDLEDSSSATDAALTTARANVQVKTNALAEADANLTNTTLTAPFDGLVAEVNVAVGDTAGSSGGSGGASGGASAAGGTSSTSSAAIVLISKDTFTVDTSVSVADVASVSRGLQAVITPTGSTDPVYGTVSSVGVVASSGTSGSSSTFPVTIKITGSQPDLLAGSSATVEIVTAQYTDVIAVSSGALTTTDGVTTVKKMVDGSAVDTEVTTGAVIDNQTIITEGLSEGDQIVVTGRVVTASGSGNSEQSSGQEGFPSGGEMGGGGFSGGEMPSGGQMPGGQGGQGGGRG